MNLYQMWLLSGSIGAVIGYLQGRQDGYKTKVIKRKVKK